MKYKKIDITIFLLLAILIIFVDAEIILRKIGYKNIAELYELDKRLIFKLAPNKKINIKLEGYNFSVSTNSRGFRGREFPIVKKKNEVRIICIGDSSTFGWGLEYKDTWADKLEQKLNKQRCQKEFLVIDAGVPSNTSFQGLNFLKDQAFIYNPDIIIIAMGRNDIDILKMTEEEVCRATSPGKIFFYNLSVKSRVICLVLFRCHVIRERLLNNLDRFFNHFLGLKLILQKILLDRSVNRVPIEKYIDNLKKVIEICNNNNVRLVFLNMGWNTNIHNNDEHDDVSYLEATSIVGRKNNIPVVEFSRANIKPELFLRDNVHPSIQGNEIISNDILNTLMKRYHLCDN